MRDNPEPLLDYLYGLTLHGIKLGLNNIRAMLNAVGNPQDRYPTLHITGTNGKGSTIALLDAMLRAAGYRTGRFTSPHLIRLNERFQIDGVPISDDVLLDNIACFRAIAERRNHPPTFFELNTAIAFRCFHQARVDVALIEVGMGGRLDSTNVIHPLISAITNIDLEHTQYLGDTLEEIAYEKGGIIKEGVPVVITETRAAPLNVLLACARQAKAPAQVIRRDFQTALRGRAFDQRFDFEGLGLALDNVPLALNGEHQAANAAAATAIAALCMPHFSRLDASAIQRGLRSARWPCRLEQVMASPPVIIDVAHNPAGAARLAQALERCVTILAVSSDKDIAGMLAVLAPITSMFVLTSYEGTRALPLSQLAEAASGYPHRVAGSTEEALAIAFPMASADCPLLITGSIYLAGEARQLLTDYYGAPPLQF